MGNMLLCCCGGRDAKVDPASSHSFALRRERETLLPRSSSFLPPSSSWGRRFLSALHIDSSSLHEGNIMFVIYGRFCSYEIRAFNLKGEQIPEFTFYIDEDATSLPHYAGFGAVNSTLYMIGGYKAIITADSLRDRIPTVDTHMIDFRVIPRFPNNSLPANHARLGLVKPGPPLNARKLAPVVIVVGCKLYAFSRFVMLKESLPNFEVLDTSMEVPQWAVLPEPPFKVSLSIEDRDSGIWLEIMSHALCEDNSGLVIWVSGKKYHGLFKLDFQSLQWSLVSRASVPFYGGAVSMFKTYYAFRCNRALPESTVCSFVGTMAPRVEEVADIESSPRIVRDHHLSQIGLMSDTLFVARIGYASHRDRSGHHLVLDKFKVSIERGIAKATKFRRRTFELEDQGKMCDPTLYCVPWVRE